jgi:hypothetical protein
MTMGTKAFLVALFFAVSAAKPVFSANVRQDKKEASEQSQFDQGTSNAHPWKWHAPSQPHYRNKARS